MNGGTDRTMNGGVRGSVRRGMSGGARSIRRNAPRLTLAVFILLKVIPSPAGAAEPGGLDEPRGARAFDFSSLTGVLFTFSSGAGAWRTNVVIHPDGTFSGQYSDANMGETGPGYPDGTVYVSNFSGSFLPPAKTDGAGWAYTLQCGELSREGTPDEEKIIGGVRYVNAPPYGFENAAGESGVTLFVPGTPYDKLPESYLRECAMVLEAGEIPALENYILYVPSDGTDDSSDTFFCGSSRGGPDMRVYDIDWK